MAGRHILCGFLLGFWGMDNASAQIGDPASDGPEVTTAPTPSPDIPEDAHEGAMPEASSSGNEEPEPTGPVLELPDPTETAPVPTPALPVADPVLRGLQEERFARAQSTSVGGYGELHYNLVVPDGDGQSAAQIDLHRLVLFFAHNFSDPLRFYAEVEIEHAFVEGGDESGEIGVEQAFIDWRLLDDRLGLRAGVVLVPMGIINQWHEPPVFHGVERPAVDRVVIPTTWREGGIGVFGEPVEGLRYELYVMSGLDPAGFSASNGLRGGRQHVFEASTDGLAVAGRVEYEPLPGLLGGLSAYWGQAGPNADLVTDCTTDPVTGELVGCVGFDGDVPVLGFSADARLHLAGIEARAVAAYFSVGDTEPIRSGGIDVASGLIGMYAEVGYDVLSLVESEHQLVPFMRLERYDPTFRHDEAAVQGTAAATDLVVGATYRPIPQIALKADVTRHMADAGAGRTVLDLGVGWMF